MTEEQSNDVKPLDNVNPPKIFSPVADAKYSSPVTAKFEGTGGQTPPVFYEGNFFPSGGRKQGSLVSNTFTYDQPLDPGPHKFDCRLKGAAGHQSDYTFIDWFYVLTPPRTKSM